MSHWGIDDLVKEITDLAEIEQVRKGEELITRLVAQLSTKISYAGEISPSALLKLTQHLAATSLSDTIKRTLQSCLDERAMSSCDGPLKLISKPQTMTSVWNYLDEDEAKDIATAPLPTMVNIVCNRMKKVGVKALKEKTKKATVAYLIQLLVTRGEAYPMPAEIYKLGEYLSNAFSACSQAALVSGLAVYPEFPKDVGGEPWMNSMVTVFCMLCKLLSLRSLLAFWFILFI